MKHFILLIVLFLSIRTVHAEPNVHFWIDNDYSGNDMGYTGGLNLDICFPADNGFAVTYRFYTALYGQRVLPYGDPKNPQYQVFTDWAHAPANVIALPSGEQDERIEQNMTASIMISRTLPQSWLSYSLEGGVTQTESRSGYFPGMAGFQQILHHVISAIKYNIISDGIPSRYGIFIRPMVYAEVPLTQSKFSLSFRSNLGGTADTEGRRTFLLAAGGFSLRSGNLTLDSIIETQMSVGHKQAVLNEALTLNFGHTSVILGVIPSLTSTGYTDQFDTAYTDNDLIYHLGVNIAF